MYKRMLKAWRRRLRRHFLILGGVFVLIAAPLNLAASRWHGLTWTAGMCTGALATAFIALRLAAPAHIDNWLLGAWGEERTAKELRKLDKRTWRVLHDLDSRRGNFDHVVIGPPGVFVIDSKNWYGEVSVSNELATVRPLENPERTYVDHGLPRRMRAYAAEMSDKLHAANLRVGWVHPVVAIWAKFPENAVGDERLAYIHGGHLTEWLRRQPPKLRADQVDTVAAVLTSA